MLIHLNGILQYTKLLQSDYQQRSNCLEKGLILFSNIRMQEMNIIQLRQTLRAFLDLTMTADTNYINSHGIVRLKTNITWMAGSPAQTLNKTVVGCKNSPFAAFDVQSYYSLYVYKDVDIFCVF